MFASIDQAAHALLLTTCKILNAEGVRYVVAGGWVPVLRGGAPALRHPGTRDVDILFKDNVDHVKKAAEALMRKGYTPSAKHEFQLLLPIDIGQKRFIFNVDLMHSTEQHRRPLLFEDIFELGVDDAYDPTGKRWLKSIKFVGAEVIFERALWSRVSATGAGVDGADVREEIPLLDETALVLSKARSAENEKRTRDAFDIYYVMSGPKRDRIVAALRDLSQEYSAINEQLDRLRRWIGANKTTFSGSVRQFGNVSDAATEVLGLLSEITLGRSD